MGVMIHGAIRNSTVSVKMGVSGISWVWERRGGDPKVSSGCFSLLPSKVGDTDNHTFIEHLLCAGPWVFLHAPIHFCLTPGATL